MNTKKKEEEKVKAKEKTQTRKEAGVRETKWQTLWAWSLEDKVGFEKLPTEIRSPWNNHFEDSKGENTKQTDVE